MTMEAVRARRLRATWKKLDGRFDEFGEVFYRNLFHLAPDMRILFPVEMHAQSGAFVAKLEELMSVADRPELLRSQAVVLAIRHLGHGVTAEHYNAFGPALIAALRQMLGDDFTPEDEAAWAASYADLAATMVAAAYPDRPLRIH